MSKSRWPKPRLIPGRSWPLIAGASDARGGTPDFDRLDHTHDARYLFGEASANHLSALGRFGGGGSNGVLALSAGYDLNAVVPGEVVRQYEGLNLGTFRYTARGPLLMIFCRGDLVIGAGGGFDLYGNVGGNGGSGVGGTGGVGKGGDGGSWRSGSNPQGAGLASTNLISNPYATDGGTLGVGDLAGQEVPLVNGPVPVFSGGGGGGGSPGGSIAQDDSGGGGGPFGGAGIAGPASGIGGSGYNIWSLIPSVTAVKRAYDLSVVDKAALGAGEYGYRAILQFFMRGHLGWGGGGGAAFHNSDPTKRGAGGAGGGAIYVETNRLVVPITASTFDVHGGNGGSDRGGGGGGGTIFILYRELVIPSGSLTAICNAAGGAGHNPGTFAGGNGGGGTVVTVKVR